MKPIEKRGPVVEEIEAIFIEAEQYFDVKVIRWLRERIIPAVEELELDTAVMTNLLLESDD